MRTSTIILTLALVAILSLGATSLSFYAPTTSGTSGQVLVSNGPNTAPTWKTPKKWYRHSVCIYDNETWMMNVEFITDTATAINTKAKVAAKLKEQNHISKERCKFSVGMQNGEIIYYGLYSTDGSTLYTFKKKSDPAAWAPITWDYFVDTVQEISLF